jgi:cyclase
MKTVKIMPCLDMKDGRLVKGVHFVDLKDAGDPVKSAALYLKEGADELATGHSRHLGKPWNPPGMG